MKVMTVIMCFEESLMSCAHNKINSVCIFYIYLPWLQFFEGRGIFLEKISIQKIKIIDHIHQIHANITFGTQKDVAGGPVFIKRK